MKDTKMEFSLGINYSFYNLLEIEKLILFRNHEFIEIVIKVE